MIRPGSPPHPLLARPLSPPFGTTPSRSSSGTGTYDHHPCSALNRHTTPTLHARHYSQFSIGHVNFTPRTSGRPVVAAHRASPLPLQFDGTHGGAATRWSAPGPLQRPWNQTNKALHHMGIVGSVSGAEYDVRTSGDSYVAPPYTGGSTPTSHLFLLPY